MENEKKKEEVYEAGSFIVNTLNEMEEKERKDFLKANVGAIISLTKISEEEKQKILEEIKLELSKRNSIDYIG